MDPGKLFKGVRYVGVDPTKMSWAERGTVVLAEEVQTWREEVEVEWDGAGAIARPAGDRPQSPDGLTLELRLKLPNSTGIVRRYLAPDDFTDEARLRWACRGAWGRLLDKHLAQGAERLRQYIREPVEV